MIGICLFIISTGLFIRGLLYHLASITSMNSKFKIFSISNNEDPFDYTKENALAGKAYMIIGLIISLFTIVLLFTYYKEVTTHWMIYIFSIMFIDFFINMLIHIRIQLDKQL